MFWSFDLPAMPVHRFRIVPDPMFVTVLLCSAFSNSAWQAGIRILILFPAMGGVFGFRILKFPEIPNINNLAATLTFPWKAIGSLTPAAGHEKNQGFPLPFKRLAAKLFLGSKRIEVYKNKLGLSASSEG